MNNLVRTMVILLTIQALPCIAVVIDRARMLVMASRRSRRSPLAGQATPTFGDTSATYAGAFAPNAEQSWAAGWTAYPAN